MPDSPIEIKNICVFCGSADNLNPLYLAAASQVGQLLASRCLNLVYGAGRTGLMGALAEGVLHSCGQVIGIVPDNLNTAELVRSDLTRLETVPDIQTRKARMYELADAFIALPGGYGTLDELFETLTWAQIGLHAKPVGLLNTLGYYDPLIEMIEKARREHFIYDEHRDLFVCDTDPEALLEKILNFQSPAGLERWVNR